MSAKTYSYSRVSTAGQVEGTSLLEQQERNIAIASYHHLTIDETFVEGGVSGSVALAERPEGKALCDLVQRGDTIIAAKLDRLFRDAGDALTMAKQWRDAGITLIVADISADPVTTDGVGQLVLSMLAVIAEWERARIRERVSAGKARKRAVGGYIGGKAPWGHRLEGSRREAKIVPEDWYPQALKEIRERRQRGQTLREISQAMKAKDIRCCPEKVRQIVGEAG